MERRFSVLILFLYFFSFVITAGAADTAAFLVVDPQPAAPVRHGLDYLVCQRHLGFLGFKLITQSRFYGSLQFFRLSP